MKEFILKKKNIWDTVFNVLQNVGHSFMLPIALLPIAGLLLGVGASFSNMQMISSMGLEWILGPETFFNFIFTIMSKVGDIVFINLPIIFAAGVAIGMAKSEKATAALSSVISFLVMHQSISAMLFLNGKLANAAAGSVVSVCGIQSLAMGVFGGIIVGLGTAALHNRFYKIKLPDALSFFGGVRFVPIISSIVFAFFGILMYFVWPYIQQCMFAFGGIVNKAGFIGTFIYGFTERALIPLGLHHVFYMPFWYTGVGGAEIIDGVTFTGAQNILFAQLASPNAVKFSLEAAKYFTGKYPFMIFGLPGAALAMYKTAAPSKRKIAGGLLFSAALTSFLTGITEPLEFTFLFAAPLLYAIHCIFAGLSFALMHILKITIVQTFSGGIIDFILFGILQGNAKTNWIALIPVGVIYFAVYYFLFSFLIKKFNFLTPGREEDEAETKLFTRKDYELMNKSTDKDDNIAELIVNGLGGTENIKELDSCATRLRIKLADATKLDENILKLSGYSGIIKKDSSIQIIYGPRVTVIKSEVEEYINKLKYTTHD
jgi:PTS system D-glucosamine-specific IIC component